MISQTLLFILGGCVLGAIQLLAGIAIGLWLRRGDTADARQGRQDLIQAGEIVKRIQVLADEMTSSVGEHRSRLHQAGHLLTSEESHSDGSLANLVFDVIGDIVRTNPNLVSKLETAESRLKEQAAEIEAHISRSLTDPLTGLPNRREFNHRLEERMSAWNRRRETFTLLMLDVDHFKKLNDQYGHLAGDHVLAQMGRALRRAIRREDAIARYGGEEFVILLPNTSLEQSIKAAEKVCKVIARMAVDYNGRSLAVTISGGLATIQANERVESLIERADAALYAAKRAGRNRAFLHDGSNCRSTAEYQSGPQGKPESPAAKLVGPIDAPQAAKPPSDDMGGEQASEFGPYLPREEISAELAQTCDELRRFVEEHGQPQRGPASTLRE